ncbi:cytochrome c biogenesis CcdA family protein [Leucobacter sp. UT-8R-CII-1-4]|uniref:cytochrome c biogenesis CcdA family protein n=1 Tax=Leucobacter sp. UT-8R-CII-1-4 TaxID=3040075 RepID=UPI0024A7DCF1|nr:cytochrome c biogenesis CcdA family protein [Leucobacter sp. UT-8R-CII-1-4]MDI6022929.1 cytochrome c biogenesis CcdA family protein [Leucobacter sp. UT-8R-CII-1-4]
MDLSLLGAFLGGILTLLSPCSVMLLPAFFAYAFTSPGALFARTAVFFAGLCVTLVPLGVLAGTLGAWVNRYRFELVTVSAIIVIVLGAIMMLGVQLPGVVRQRGAKSASILSVFALGTVYGLAGVCAGPMLGAALTFAAFGASPLFGGLVLMVFAAGMVVPLFLLALLWDRLPAVRKLVRPREVVIGRWRNTWTNIIGGALTVAIGVLLLVTHGTTSLGGVLGATDQARLESSVMNWTAGVPDWVFIVGLLVLAAVITLIVLTRKKRTPAND